MLRILKSRQFDCLLKPRSFALNWTAPYTRSSNKMNQIRGRRGVWLGRISNRYSFKSKSDAIQYYLRPFRSSIPYPMLPVDNLERGCVLGAR